MILRLVYWWGGFVAVALFGVPRLERGDSTALAAGVLAWLGVGILWELAAWLRAHHGQPRMRARFALRPPDGRIEVIPIHDALIESNPIDRRFGRLASLDRHDLAWTREAHAHVPLDLAFPRPLAGRVVLASCFLGRDGRAWTDAEIAEAHKFLCKAVTWLEREAQRWSARVNLTIAQGYVTALDDQERAESRLAVVRTDHGSSILSASETQAVISALHRGIDAQFGIALDDFVCQVAERVEADHLVWIVHSMSAGTSEWVDAHQSGLENMPFALCYVREESSPGPWQDPPFPDPVTFVHELLHAFGATDKYDISARHFERGQVSENDVMLLHTTSLARLRVDALTAREIGWNDNGDIAN